jgi:glycosyltransferase involved in cell wall biosynthesis
MTLRILHVDTGREMRGGQRQVLLLLHGLRAAGTVCTLLAREGSPLFSVAAEAGFAVYAAGLRNLLIHSRQFDLVHAHDAHAHTQAALVSLAPFVVSRRVAFSVKGSALSRLKYRRARRFLAVSKFVKSELAAAHIPDEKIDVVYDGVDPSVRDGVWRPDGRLVALASADPAKGRQLVAQAAQLAHLDVTYSENLSADLQNASMFVYVTQSEGLGSAALLAMAMGIPVIASDIGGLREALGGGDAGLLVQNDAARIAAAMQKLREDCSLAQTLIERGKRRVAEHFTAKRLVDGTLESYRRALAV